MAPNRLLLGPCLLILLLSALAPTANSGGVAPKKAAGAVKAPAKAEKGKQPSKLPVPAKKSPGPAKKSPEKAKKSPEKGKAPPGKGKKPPGPGKKPPGPGKKPPGAGKKPPEPSKKPPKGKENPKKPPGGKKAAPAKSPPPAKKSKAPIKKDKTSVPSPPPPPPPPSNKPPSATALRFKRLTGSLEKRGVYSKYLDTVESTKFVEFLETLVGYSLTFFVVPDSIWGQLKTTRTNLRLQLLKYHTSYNMYQKAELDRLPPGAKVRVPCPLLCSPIYALQHRPGDMTNVGCTDCKGQAQQASVLVGGIIQSLGAVPICVGPTPGTALSHILYKRI